MKSIFTFLLFTYSLFINAQTFQPEYFGNFGVFYLCDFDNDGDLDFHHEDTDWDAGTFTPKRYTNNAGTFTEVFSGSINEMFGVIWMDIDDDNDMDFLTGFGKVYLNTNGNFSFRSEDIPGSLNFLDPPKGDFNSDNKPDALISIYDNIRFYPNTNSYFTNPQVISPYSSTSGYYNNFLFDFDNNGNMDLFNAGYDSGHSIDETRTRILKNSNTNFTSLTQSQNSSLFNIRTNNAAFRDHDKDFDMDLLLTDADTLRLFLNNNGTFIQSEKWNIQNIEFLKWVDIDNNGFPDIIYSTNLRKTRFLLNNGSSYELSATIINGNDFRIGDLDNDGDFDMIINTGIEAYIFYNQLNSSPFVQNRPPDLPQSLSVTQVADTTYFHWNASTDDNTPQDALTYNLYIGSASGTTDVMSPLSDLTNGYRKIVSIGNVDANLGWKIVGLPCGTYYWSVQAIDNAYAGGAFAVEQSFTISCCPTLSGLYTINNTLPSVARNYNSFTDAVEALKCGGISDAVTFDVANGTYNEQITIPYITGSSASDTITFRSASGVNTDVNLKSTLNRQTAVLILDTTAYLRFYNMTIQNARIQSFAITDTTMHCLHLTNSRNISFVGNRLIATNSLLTTYYYNVFTAQTCDTLTLINNNLINGTYSCKISNTKSAMVSGNILQGFSFSGISIDSQSDNVIVLQNNLNGLSNQGLQGITISSATNITVEKNYIYLQSNAVVYETTIGLNYFMTSDYNNIFKNNFVLLETNSGVSGLRYFQARNSCAYHNTILVKGANPTGALVTFFGNYAGNQVMNNILISQRGDIVVTIGAPSITTSLNFDFNAYYTTSANFASRYTSDYYTFTQWKSTFNYDLSSIFQNVNFTSTSDLHILSGQDFLRLNHPLAEVTDDIDAQSRSTTNPYSGADEITSVFIPEIIADGGCLVDPVNFQISNIDNIQSTLWNYGDSQTSTELNPTHTYANPGTYTVTLTVTYTNNSTQTITKEVEIYYNPLVPTIQHD